MAIERRSGRDRRDNKRSNVLIEIEWENEAGRRSGTLSDVSATGGFILSAGEVTDGEAIKIFLPLNGAISTEIDGEIVNHVFEIGFAVRFVGLSASQRDLVAKLAPARREK